MKKVLLIASLLFSTTVFAHGKEVNRGHGYHKPSPRDVVVPKVVYKPYKPHYRYKRFYKDYSYNKDYRGFIFRPIIIIK